MNNTHTIKSPNITMNAVPPIINVAAAIISNISPIVSKIVNKIIFKYLLNINYSFILGDVFIAKKEGSPCRAPWSLFKNATD